MNFMNTMKTTLSLLNSPCLLHNLAPFPGSAADDHPMRLVLGSHNLFHFHAAMPVSKYHLGLV